MISRDSLPLYDCWTMCDGEREKERERECASISALTSALTTATEGERDREREVEEGSGERGRERESLLSSLWSTLCLLYTVICTDARDYDNQYRGYTSVSQGERETKRQREKEREKERQRELEIDREIEREKDSDDLSLSPSLLQDFPATAIFHGSADQSIPLSISQELVRLLDAQGVDVHLSVYEGWTHTDAILEAPLMGNVRLFRDMLRLIYRYTEREEERNEREKASERERERERVRERDDGIVGEREKVLMRDIGGEKALSSIEQSMVNERLVRIARILNPF